MMLGKRKQQQQLRGKKGTLKKCTKKKRSQFGPGIIQ